MTQRAIIEEYFPEDWSWRVVKEVDVYAENRKFIKAKLSWWRKPRWYYKTSLGRRFTIIDELEACKQ